MRLTTLFLLALLSASAQEKPNFIVIFADDLGYGDLGVFGSKLHRTPRLDRMAAEGRRYTDFYVSANVCTPSRASLMTGSYPRRVGLHENETRQWVLFPSNQTGLSADEITLPELLKTAGYRTAIIGKWHLGDQPEFLPTRHGFDSYFGIPYSNDMGHDSRPKPYRYPPLPLLRDERVVEKEPDQRLITGRYTDEALKYIEDNQSEPFFLYLPHTMPHWPQYSSSDFAGKSQNGAWGDAVEEIDYSVGRILDRLNELGLEERTLVLFFSDNGGAIRFGSSNGPLRAGKGTTWEGGHRSALIARWPGRVPAGSVSRELLTSMDLYPTFAAWAGVEAPSDRVIDGKDIRSFFTESDPGPSPHVAYFYYFTRHLNAVRSGRWKLFVQRTGRSNRRYVNQPVEELYDLHADVGERHNVYAEHPQVVERLRGLAEQARGDLGDGGMPGAGTRRPGFVVNAQPLTADQ